MAVRGGLTPTPQELPGSFSLGFAHSVSPWEAHPPLPMSCLAPSPPALVTLCPMGGSSPPHRSCSPALVTLCPLGGSSHSPGAARPLLPQLWSLCVPMRGSSHSPGPAWLPLPQLCSFRLLLWGSSPLPRSFGHSVPSWWAHPNSPGPARLLLPQLCSFCAPLCCWARSWQAMCCFLGNRKPLWVCSRRRFDVVIPVSEAKQCKEKGKNSSFFTQD